MVRKIVVLSIVFLFGFGIISEAQPLLYEYAGSIRTSEDFYPTFLQDSTHQLGDTIAWNLSLQNGYGEVLLRGGMEDGLLHAKFDNLMSLWAVGRDSGGIIPIIETFSRISVYAPTTPGSPTRYRSYYYVRGHLAKYVSDGCTTRDYPTVCAEWGTDVYGGCACDAEYANFPFFIDRSSSILAPSGSVIDTFPDFFGVPYKRLLGNPTGPSQLNTMTSVMPDRFETRHALAHVDDVTVDLRVVPFLFPVAQFSGPHYVDVDDSVTYTSTAYDQDTLDGGGISSTRWTVTRSPGLPLNFTTTAIRMAWSQPGMYWVKLKVIDNETEQNSCSLMVDVFHMGTPTGLVALVAGDSLRLFWRRDGNSEYIVRAAALFGGPYADSLTTIRDTTCAFAFSDLGSNRWLTVTGFHPDTSVTNSMFDASPGNRKLRQHVDE